MCQNVDLTVFHTQNIHHHAWKLSETHFDVFFVLQSLGEGLKSKENYERDLSHSFSPFHDFLPTIGNQRCFAL